MIFDNYEQLQAILKEIPKLRLEILQGDVQPGRHQLFKHPYDAATPIPCCTMGILLDRAGFDWKNFTDDENERPPARLFELEYPMIADAVAQVMESNDGSRYSTSERVESLADSLSILEIEIQKTLKEE